MSDDSTLSLLDSTASLSFNTSQRHCTGWHDLSSGKSQPCPDNSKTDNKYQVCVACQKRTGFNPAFYYSTAVSPQQQARNAEPHHLYLAYMGPSYVKVGISYFNRGAKRLLDQGARAGLILETFPSALVARQYEAMVAKLDDIHETTPTRVKLALLNQKFDPSLAEKALLDTKQNIENKLNIQFSNTQFMILNQHYMSEPLTRQINRPITPVASTSISGLVKAIVGDILVTEYDNRLLALPLKPYFGYPIEMSNQLIKLDLEPEQMQLF